MCMNLPAANRLLRFPVSPYLAVFGALLFMGGLNTSANAQPGAFGAGDYFEGTVTYSFRMEGQNAEALRLINPINTMTFHIKDGNYIVHLYGEERPGELPPEFEPFTTTRLFLADSNETYMIDARNKRVFTKEKYVDESRPERPEAYPTGDSLTIAGYMCYGYRVSTPEETITHFITPKVRVNLGFYANKDEATASFLTEGLNGSIPLMTVRESRTRSITVKCTRVMPRKLTDEQFAIPEGFAIEGYDYRR